MESSVLQTVNGPLFIPETGLLLPHEHLFLDLRGPDAPGYAQADPDDVIAIMGPLIRDIRNQGVVGLVEWTTAGVGRNVHILARLAEATGLAIIAPTGVYTESFAPRFLLEMSERGLETRFIEEIETSIEGTGVRAGFIKLASSPHGLTDFERRVLRAAARAALATGVAIGSHTTSGATCLEQLSLLEQEGLPANRFIWAHAQTEPDSEFHCEAAGRGAYVEFDDIGAHLAGTSESSPMGEQADKTSIGLVTHMVNARFADRVLLSQDAGWYNANEPGGGYQRGFSYLLDVFVPKMDASGLGDAVQLIVQRNPWNAFAKSRSISHPG